MDRCEILVLRVEVQASGLIFKSKQERKKEKKDAQKIVAFI